MPPPCVHIYADRRGANESLANRGRSKPTELRPSNEDLRMNSCKCIDWQAAFAPPPLPPSLPIPFACLKCKQNEQCGLKHQDHTGSGVSITTYKAIKKRTNSEAKRHWLITRSRRCFREGAPTYRSVQLIHIKGSAKECHPKS